MQSCASVATCTSTCGQLSSSGGTSRSARSGPLDDAGCAPATPSAAGGATTSDSCKMAASSTAISALLCACSCAFWMGRKHGSKKFFALMRASSGTSATFSVLTLAPLTLSKLFPAAADCP